jgi:FkbH-like protein
MVYPEADAEVRIVFSWLDLVRFRDGYRPPMTGRTSVPEHLGKPPAAKVKCVAWDLDNTFWEGILIESGPEGVTPRKRALELVKALDERGILQTIASKNDYEVAWPVLEELGLADYFLYPAIHWGPKSASLRQIAQELNINVDTFAFIDDSVFEREEVAAALPQVRIYDETTLDELLARPEFDIEVSAESSARRLSYLAEAKRKRISQNYGDEYEHFLRDCAMTARIFEPKDEAHVARCLELLQRSNQLNLSTYRYKRDELDDVLASADSLCVALAVDDRFGNYGTVGFARVDVDGVQPVLRDWVASCRVAKKKVENAWFQWLVELLRAQGHERLEARFLPTDRNGVLKSILDEVGFIEVANEGDTVLLELDLSADVPHSDIVTVKTEVPG